MKHLNRILALVLALMLILGLATTAYAEDQTYSITIKNDKAGHTYEAYQIFTGDLSGEGEDADGKTSSVLSNIVWGEDVTEAGKTSLLNFKNGNYASPAALAEALTVDNIADFAKAAAGAIDGTPVKSTNEHSEGNYTIADLKPGYYLIKDGSLSPDAHDAYTSYIIEVVENSTVTPKSSVPTVEKKVDDKNDSNTNEDAEVWQDSADYDIGDEVPFKLEATLANNVTDYDVYKVVFHDELSAGLTYTNNSIVVKVGNTVVYNSTQNKSGVSVDNSGTKLTVTIDDVTTAEIGGTNESKVTVTYTAKLNENAVIGRTGNPNTVYLEYSNNPNVTGSGGPTGKTPEDMVIVFTYAVDVDKVNESNQPLVGATFALYKKVLTVPEGTDGTNYITVSENGSTYYWDLIKEIAGTNSSDFTWTGVDDGTYMLKETKTPAGYNTIDPITFTISATHDTTAAEPKLTELSGGTFTTVTESEGGNTVFTGTLTTDVVNKAGTTLPETGGIGTTIFYVVGGLLVLAAIVLLVTKKRMASAK